MWKRSKACKTILSLLSVLQADGSASVGIAPVNTESVTAGAPMVCQVCNMTIPTTSLRTHVEAEHCPAVARFRCKQCRKIHGFNEANVKTHLRHRHHLQEAEIEDNIMKCENGLTVAVWSLAFNNCFPSYDTRGELGKLFKLNVSNQKRFTCLSCIGVDVPEAHRLLHVAKKHETEELYHCTSVGCTDIFLSETAHDDHARHAHNGVGEPLIGTIATKAFIENRDKDILKTFFSA
ncbi:hypothetical protein PFISCL1PPCAC_3655 [Pristionchus fissidentatus]|uniref:C2H2-type domain-containing protein n=1 Tax=Pristionchus fissidentatus TaxID=1538716 RepID=A0AAV5V1R3_9BILA|nr:hypothetical protein PFISCL1PPCAC_3655 [Pristionchus fissidentatus]